MEDLLTEPQEPLHQAGRESLIESFVIEGLYGYRTIKLSSKYAATIMIAKNGSGKTTLLATLDAFLRCQFLRLRDLEFSRLRCKLRGIPNELVLEKNDLVHLFEIPESGELTKAARRFDLEPVQLFNFLERDFTENVTNFDDAHENPVISAIMRSVGYSRREAIDICNKIRQSYYDSNPPIKHIKDTVSNFVRDIDLVYLPTYRRIELPLTDTETDRNPYRRKRPHFKIPNVGLFTGDIQFGLADISERLAQLNQRLLTDSNISYREISANIINELLDGSFDSYDTSQRTIPDRDELNLFFSRLKDGRRRVGPFTDVTIPNIDKIYSGEGIPDETNKFLSYFLTKLHSAIQATRDIEVMVEDFINVCNKYLSRLDPSTNPGADAASPHFDNDGKELRLNRRNLNVHMQSVALRRPITLNALSSGEKQMISLFGKLFLYEKEKIILVDEPELSLSIDWQRQLLVDFLRAPRCRQVIAITHSPFVFDNELEPYARSMETEISVNNAPSVELDDEGESSE